MKSSHFKQIALPAVHAGGIAAAALAHHIRRGTASVAGVCPRRPGGRRRRPSRQTQDDHRLPNAHDARAVGARRTRRIGHRRLPIADAHHGGIRLVAQKDKRQYSLHHLRH